ncbi:MAG TPA: lytic transglycosylase domain-containing protein [Trebonia sp.]
MLAERPPASTGDSRTAVAGSAAADSGPRGRSTTSGTGSFGARSTRKKRGLFHRTGITIPAAFLALLLVVVVWGAVKVMDPQGTGASSLFQSIDGLGNSGSVALLEQERQTLIEMTAASKTLSTASKPATTDPDELIAEQNESESQSETGGTGISTTAPPADPTAAQETAKSMLASFGFSESTQWPCLYDIWEQESTWNVYAENAASGAYGIPQALPGDKMASVGADWQTDATTQITWGLGYIKQVYGTPCAAWQNEVDYGYY